MAKIPDLITAGCSSVDRYGARTGDCLEDMRIGDQEQFPPDFCRESGTSMDLCEGDRGPGFPINISIVLTNNRDYGCFNRRQTGTDGAECNSLFDDRHHSTPLHINFVCQEASLDAEAVKAGSIAELAVAPANAKLAGGLFVVVTDTKPYPGTANPHRHENKVICTYFQRKKKA